MIISFLLFLNQGFAQNLQESLERIDSTMSGYYQPDAPGAQLAISRDGEIIYSKAWGLADLERNVPLTTNSVIEAGSVSKQFTAAALLLLEQQGKLSLNDDMRKYIPELPDYGDEIKIRHMIHHTSGLRDWGSVTSLTGWPRSEKFYNNNDALEIISRQKELNNKPGDEYIYSNSNYNLSAIIVQRVSGMSLADFSEKYIFEPAGMTHTQWRDNPNRIVPNRAIAYEKNDEGYEIDMPNEYVYGNGGLLTTTEDLLKWNEFFLGEKLGTESLLAKQIHTEPLNNGLMNEYGAGLFIQKDLGWQNISHGGATAGYRAYLTSYPELDLSVALLSNTSEHNIGVIAKDVTGILVSDKSEKEEKNNSSIDLPQNTVLLHEGWYRNDRDGSGMEISLKDKSLMANGVQLQPLSKNKFAYGNNFLLVYNGKRLRHVIPGRDTIPYSRVEPAIAGVENYHEYTGKYFSEETNSTVTVKVENDKLILELKADEEFQMRPSYKDGFKIGNGNSRSLYFTRDRNGEVAAFRVSIPRARNIEFVKQNSVD